MIEFRSLLLAFATIGMIVPAAAAPHKSPLPRNSKVLDAVVGCATIGQPEARLACYDKNIDALKSAEASSDVVVVDQSEVRQAKKSLFGFNLSDIDLFSKHAATPKDEPEAREIQSSVSSAQMDQDGMWIIQLDGGATWRQTGGMIARGPRPGDKVTIRRGALGSYFLRVGTQPAVRARREG